MCPLRWLWIRLPGTRQFVALHYTHPCPASQLEIFIFAIHFSDAPPHPLFDDSACKLREQFPLFDLHCASDSASVILL
jgi:hypothetical protein